jgi:hypothetical protein
MSYNYNPIPPRVWSRVQAQCTYIVPDSSYNSVYIPITNQTVSLAQAISLEKNLYKGNILQYKNNSSRLTKNQKYSQISKGLWCNRTKVFATQGQTYTNPNTTGLLRVNYTTLPYPNQIVGKPNNISGPFQYNVPNPSGCPTTSVQDGGNLVCGTYVNPCTGNIIQTIPQPELICNSSTASDVPGIPVNLCWSPNFQTFFPRNNLTMSNSLNKWPQGYKGLVSAVTPVPPILSIDASTNTTLTLSWTLNSNNCIPISSFNIYQNGVIVQTQPYQITSTIIYGLNDCSSYSFYVTSLSNNIESIPSNIIIYNVEYPLPPIISGSYDPINIGNINLTWNDSLNCSSITAWNIYQDGVLTSISNNPSSPTLSYTFSGLTIGQTYNYYIVAVGSNGTISTASNTISITLPAFYSTIGNPTILTNSQQTVLIFNYSSSSQSVTFNYNYNINLLMIGGGSGGGASYNYQGSDDAGAGGGGGGIVNTTFNNSNSNIYNIVVGTGGSGGTGNGGIGGGGNNSLFYINSSSYLYVASGALISSGSFNGGTGGQGYTNVTAFNPNNPNTGTPTSTSISTSFGGYGGSSYNGLTSAGGPSDLTTFNVPILGQIYISGGGGSGNSTNGGGSGVGTGGAIGTSSTSSGTNANISSNYYGGAGGGGSSISVSSGGNGGTGVVILWWQTI